MIVVVLIKPDKKINRIITNLKNIYKKKYNKLKYIDDYPHITIFKSEVTLKKTQLKKIFFKKKYNKFNVSTGKFSIFKNDPITRGETHILKVKKNYQIKQLQIKFANVLSGYRKLRKVKFENKILNLNFKKYGFPFVGKIWLPHITIASILDKITDNKVIKRQSKNYNFICNKIYVCSLDRKDKLKKILTLNLC